MNNPQQTAPLNHNFMTSTVNTGSELDTVLAEVKKSGLNHNEAFKILEALKNAAKSHNQRPLVAEILQQDRFIYDLAWATGEKDAIRSIVLEMDEVQIRDILKADNALLGMVWNGNGRENGTAEILNAIGTIDPDLYKSTLIQLDEFKMSSDKEEYPALQDDIWLGK